MAVPGLLYGLLQNAFFIQHFHLLLMESVNGQEPLLLDAVQAFKGIFE